uniref:Transposase (Putative), gypsy type n=1 Tax=Tanacetum cinerariifolium TaxID=118510 RepID=A0A699H0C8_TANCI|nr:transposase (putative), gypsy type [Tanacetum cinerariifolium]
MSFIKRQGSDVVCYTKPLDSLKGWNDHFFWVDAFACPASFPWHTSKSVSRDAIPKSSELNAKHYATLVAYPAPFHKYPKPFLCLVGLSRNFTLDENTYPRFLRDSDDEMDLLSFIRIDDPTKVRIGERQRDEDEPKLLETTVGRVVLLLSVVPDRSSGELEASVDNLFDEGGSGEQAGDPIPTLPFVTSSISATLERKGEGHTDSVTRLNLRTIGAPQRFVISSDSSHHSGANIANAEVDSFVKPSVIVITTATNVTPTAGPAMVKEKIVKSFLFSAESASSRIDPTLGGFADLSGSDFLVGGIRTVISPDTDLQKFFASIRGMEHEQLFIEFNVGAARKMSLSAEVRMHAEYNIKEKEKIRIYEVQALTGRNATLEKEKGEFDVKAADLAALVKVGEQEVADLDDVVTSEMNDKFDKLDTDLVEMALHLEEKFYPHLLTTISGRRRLLTYGLELSITKCLNSTEYLSTLGAAIGKADEKGMQDGLSAEITHDAEELKSNKDASIDTIMNLLRLEDSLANKLGLTESQPHVDQLMVPIHHFPDQRVVGANALSLLLDVSSSRVQRIKKNIFNHRSALRNVFVPLSEPMSVTDLTGTKGTSNVIPTTVDTTTALSVTFAFASRIPPISTDNYEIVHAGGGESVGADANPFPNVDDAELNTS